MPEFVFVMEDLRKVVPPDRILLDEISLSFLPGAKIGVLGHNGAGKSTLLKIMAGLDKEFVGVARPAEGLRVGFLPQEPQLDETKTVLGIVDEGVAETRALLARFEEVSAKFAEPLDDDEMNALLEEQAKLQDKIDAVNAWELDRTLEVAMDALRLPPGDAEVRTLSGGERRRVALCRLLLQKPDLLLLDEPTNHLDAESVAWLERFLHEYPGTVVAVTHDRYFLDNVAGWILELDRGRGIPYKGNYTAWLEQKQKRLELEEKKASARQRTLQRELEWVQMSPRARQAKSKARVAAYEKLRAEEENRAPETVEIAIPPGPRLGDKVIEAERVVEGLRRPAPDRRARLQAAARRHRRRDRRQRRGQDDAVPHASPAARSPTPASFALGETVKLAYVDQARSELDPKKTVFEAISGGEEKHEGRQPRAAQPRLRGQRSASRAPTSRSASRCSRAASATACTWRARCARAATCCCSTSRPTTSTSTRCARSRRRCSASRAAWS